MSVTHRKVLKKIGQSISEKRVEKYTQSELAEQLNITQKHISRIESGLVSNLSIPMLLNICACLDVKLSELCDGHTLFC